MCGIAGIVRREDPRAPLRAPLQRMQAALRHRGPDDAGLYQSAVSLDGWQCGLAHTRLAILDLSAAGHQPMASPDGRFHITFNGEIYNFRELRAQLIAAGESFHTETDTELLLRLYLLRGPDCLRDLAGMFAFAVWDAQEQSLFLARDPLGVKPLYFCIVGSTLAFASELRSLLAADLLPRRLSARALTGFLLYGSVQESPTLIAGASLLPAGCWLQWRGGRIREQRYYDVQFQLPATTPDRDAVAATRVALVDSVRRHFVSDVPVGIFLSGGVDSTALVALARHIGVSKIRTFSLAFSNHALDEGDLAASTALHFGTEHHVWRLEEVEAKLLLQQYWNSVDQPSVDGFNTFCVSKWAH
ncbi:MAG: asparagine synthase (glutamine-hydrolyzing), partial [Phycisphaerae bacterium]